VAKTLTAISCRNARPGAARREIPDGGCGGLYLVVQPSGAKSWAARFRFRGAPRKLTLGPFLADGQHGTDAEPRLDAPLTLAMARELCARAKREARSGVDPTFVKQKKRIEQREVEANTLQAISEEYLRQPETTKLRTLSQRAADLRLLYRSLGRQPIAQIRRSYYRRELDHIATTRGVVRADRVLSALTRLLNWHASRDDYFVSPIIRGMRRTKPKDLARSHVLDDSKLKQLWLAAEKDTGQFGAYLRFVLLTAARRSEAGGLRRSELSNDGTVWIIAASRYKNKKDMLIPLSEAAQRIIAAQPVLGDFIFSADGSRPLGGFAERKANFDRKSGVRDYRLHDLRRTTRTLLSRAGINSDLAELCLGHAKIGIRGTYDRHEYEAEKRHAFEQLAAQIERIVHPPEAAVTEMAEARMRRRR
jgi:integrase